MKHHQRLDYSRLAEVLHERGIANVDAIRELLQQSREGGMPFCEALVTTNLVPDWDLSRIVCETFSLPFLPVDMLEPNEKVRGELDIKLFRSYQVVPLDRFGQVLTVVMPALVPADVLAMLSAASDLVILPVVGTVETNRRWILENLGAASKAADVEGGWINLFDQADAEVNASLGGFEDESEASDGGLAASESASFALPELDSQGADAVDLASVDDLPVDDGSFDLAATVAPVPDEESLDLGILDDLGDLPGIEPGDEHDLDMDEPAPKRSQTSTGAVGGLDLPPMPEFGADRQAG
ncbi:MAG: hypothetical protein R3F49_18620 [Planctomycetota bacterium]